MRASLGPRFARVHVGSGSPGISTGVGPFGYYTSLGGGSRGHRGTRTSTPAGPSAAERDLIRRSAEAAEYQRALDEISGVHRVDFPVVGKPIAQPEPTPTLDDVTRDLTARATRQIPIWDRRARREAAAAAARTAADEWQRLAAEAEGRRQATQEAYDEWWARLLACDPEITLPFLNAALADNAQPSAAVDCGPGEVTVTLVVPPITGIPERRPDVTPGGRPTTKAMSATDRASLHETSVCAHLLVTAKEVIALCPGAEVIRLVGFADGGEDSFGDMRLHPVIAGVIDVQRCRRVTRWDLPATQVFHDVATEILVHKVRGALRPLTLDDQPDLTELTRQIAMQDAAAFAGPPPGWHPDPHGESRLRWWDGSVWTEHVHG